jgi:hypothetical protein
MRSYGFEPLLVPMHLGLSYRPLVSLKLEYELLESLQFNAVPDFPQAQISNILRVQVESTQCGQKFTPNQNLTRGSFLCSACPTERLSFSPIINRYFLRVLQTVLKSVSTLNCLILKENNLVLSAKLRP